MNFNKEKLINSVEEMWESSIIPTLSEYIKIPNKSAAFDSDWVENGYIESAVKLVEEWCRKQDLKGITISIERIKDRTPLLFIEIAGAGNKADQTVLLYGHLDKQPEMTGWDEDKGPWQPVRENDKLYGRGSADDGYAVFSIISAIKCLQEQNIPHARCIVVIESSEEGGKDDLSHYIVMLQERIGKPSLVFCLDAGCGNYDQLWLTTSLRGAIVGNLSVELLREGVHSGDAGGVVASSLRVMRILLDRLEDARTGDISLKGVHTPIPQVRLEQAKEVTGVLGNEFKESYPLIQGVEPVSDDNCELILNRTWRATLSYIGADGIPGSEQAGNVLRPSSVFKLSMRIPPNSNAKETADEMKQLLEENPPYHAKVNFSIKGITNGWNAPEHPEWLEQAFSDASDSFFGKEPLFMGEGGSIPFMNLLSRKYPEAKFMVSGILGPNANAHGPNEFLHIPSVKKLTCCVAWVLAKHSDI
jgi:acetylornithine deacetylase/succinyl-diaminopimelate desuccinylase-like protein